MADRRVRVPKDKVDLVKRLLAVEGGIGPFKLQADVIAFAAALGARRGVLVPVDEGTKEPIRQEVFERQGYDTLINLLAVYHEKNPTVLANTDAAEDRRLTIFEQYANGGLQVLQQELRGSVDYVESIMLLAQTERERESQSSADDLNLTELIGTSIL